MTPLSVYKNKGELINDWWMKFFHTFYDTVNKDLMSWEEFINEYINGIGTYDSKVGIFYFYHEEDMITFLIDWS